MRVAVCDDDAVCRNEISKMCHMYMKNNRLKTIEVLEFHSGEELLQSERPIDLLFLDYGLPGMSGLDVKERIESKSEFRYMVFTTSYKEAVWEAFGVKTLGYLIKPIQYESVCNFIDRIFQFDSVMKDEIEFEFGEESITLSSDEVIYIEGQGIYTKVISTENEYIVRRSLNEWGKCLNNKIFFRIHKSFIVNMSFVKSVTNTVNLESGDQLNLSRNRVAQIKKEYFEYIRRCMSL